MQRFNYDPSVYDYTWKQNRLAKDKESLKKELMSLINKKPKKQDDKQDVSQIRFNLFESF